MHGEYFSPTHGEKFPLAILVHGMGDRSTVPCQMLARDLARQGIASFILYLVFHSSRMPQYIKKKLPYLSSEEWFQGYETSVIDIRQVLDWADASSEIDHNNRAVIGMSLGGFMSAIAMGIDSRINAGIIMLAGGNYPSRTWHRLLRAKFTEASLMEEQLQYTQYLANVAEKGIENAPPPLLSYLTDPVTFASRLRNRPMMLVNARWDERIPRQTTIDMWEAFGRPPIRWFPSTHSTIWAFYPLVRKEITVFLHSSFNHY